MVSIVKIEVECDDEVFQVWSCTEEWQEYFSKCLSIPLNITQIDRPQKVEIETFSQLLEHWSVLTNLNSVLADTKALKALLLRQNPTEQ